MSLDPRNASPGESGRRFLVIGPDRQWKEVICDDGSGPIEHFRDVYLVDGARTRKEARWAAFQRAKANNDAWWKDLTDYEQHPLSGVECEPADGYPIEDEDPRYLVLIGSTHVREGGS